MKVKSFSFAPILALLFCFATGVFADDVRSNVKINPATPMSNEYRDDGWLDGKAGRSGWTWHGDQGVYNFTTIKNRSDELNQKPIVRFGGAGTYVFGDYAVTGKPVISLSWPSATGSGYMWGAKGTYIKDDGDGQFYLNSSKAVLRLPKGVTKDDIVYARLYWQGNIFSTTDFNSEAEYNSKDGKKLTGFAEGYTRVKFKMKSSKGKASVIKDVQRDRCEGTAAWNFLAKSRKPLRLRLKYGCTKDITDLVKEYFKDYSDSIEFTVGNVKTSDGEDQSGADFTNLEFNSVRIGPYGGWGIIVVYDKTANSRRDLLNNLQSNDSVTGQKMTYKEAVEYKNKYFKPKNVTIYGDYFVVTPWKDGGYTPININATISGFYTPRSGSVNAKLGFLGFGGERQMTSDEYFKVQHKGTAQMDSLYGSSGVNQRLANDRANIYDGSVALLINDNGTYKYSYPYGTGYLGGFDLDEFDIGSKMKNAQSSLNISLGAAYEDLNGGQADQNFISMIAISADLYVPQMCYQYEVYNASNWVKFFDNDGNRRSEEDVKKLHEPPEQIKNPVVAGENIYYRMKFENRLNGGDSEDAAGAVVSIDFGQAGATYTKDSATINNELVVNDPITTTTNTIPAAAAEQMVYLRDGQKGAYETMKDVIKGGTPNVTKAIYKDRQFTALDGNILKFYIGQGAGDLTPSSTPGGSPVPVGGLMQPGKAAYGEFNATVNTGATILQAPAVTLSYKMSIDIGGGQRVFIEMDSASELELCDATKVSKSVNILPLSGLQVVNKNFSKNDDDDRLYTQISEMPFDAKLIFRPDYESQFCKKYKDDTGKCEEYIDAAANSKYFKRDPLTGKLVYIGSEARKLEKFDLSGKLYLSVVRARNAATTSDKVADSDKGNSAVYSCRSVTDSLKIPFKMKDKTDYTIDKEVDFKGKSILELNDIEIGDAYQGLTFMLSYRPDNQVASGSDLDQYIKNKDLNNSDPKAYYSELKKWELKKRYGYCETGENFSWCNTKLTAEQKKDIWENKIQPELKKLEDNIKAAKDEFGIQMSKDGSFHICGSDNFVLRPAYFNVDTKALKDSGKYSKIVDTTASGDITKKGDGSSVLNPSNLRVGGDYTQNADILAHVISARSYSGNGVPNYTAEIGGDLGNQRYHLRKSYGADSDDTQDISTKIRGIQTYLRPFISNECAANVATQSYYVDRKNASTTLKRGVKEDSCYGGTAVEYSGAKYNAETGKYEIDPEAIKKGSFGKSDDVSCVLNGTSSKFDAAFRRVWDKNAVSLWANFNARNIEETEGVAKFDSKGHVQGAYLMTQSRKDPAAKDISNGILYTEANYTTTKPKTAMYYFNYYNVGDVLVSVYDNSWTDAYSDQTYSKKWKSAKCIINSSSNTPNAKGMIGCDVGMRLAANKDKAINDNIVLRYRPDRIRVSLTSLDNGVTRGVGDNNISGGISAYTYFNAPDIENDVVVYADENSSQNLAVTHQISQLAKLKVNAVAYLSDKVYKDVIATLYDGYKMEIGDKGKEKLQAVCGFASDLDFALDFGFDCEHNNADGRCSKATDASKTSENTNYVPYPDKPTVKYEIPSDTQYFAKDSSVCLDSTGYDSRCYKYNVRSSKGSSKTDEMPDWEEAASSGDAGYGLPIPLKIALNYYSDASLRGGLINKPQGGTGINYDSKSNKFRILAQGFREGQTPDSTVYFNFARMHKTPSTPVLIYASDFDIQDGTALKTFGKFWPSKFDSSYKAISDTDSEDYNKTDIKLSKEDFDVFITRKVSETKAASKAAYIAAANSNSKTYATGKTVTDFSDNVGTYALFVYGTSYDKSLGAIVQQATTGTPISVPIYTQIYCGRTDKCSNMPAPSDSFAYEVPVANASGKVKASNIFTVLAAEDRSLTDFTKFVVNTRATLNDIGTEFVSAYDGLAKEDDVKVDVQRGNVVSNGQENITISSNAAGYATIRIITNPWLIHTPALNDKTMFTANDGGAYSKKYPGVRQYYNPLRVHIKQSKPTVWGGEGQVKSGIADDVGSFAGGSSSDNSTSDTSTRILDSGDVRDIYNQKTDW
ncbi:hypothetical protein [uncultured Campylobacter sp.]|uniref:hypothetical protein n=1 Tax=uncultured Campylobacter sp. TaxID=218934 RepID=UPI002622ACC4|nr:hypothetical protein [uncultured Campylobacter sp.]